MIENIITVGLFDKETKKQEVSIKKAASIIINAVDSEGLCATIFTKGIYGIYRHEDGTKVREPSIRLEICCEESEMRKVANVLHIIRAALNQESILHKHEVQTIDFFED